MRAADSLEHLLHAGGYPSPRVAYTAHGALAREYERTLNRLVDALEVSSVDACGVASAGVRMSCALRVPRVRWRMGVAAIFLVRPPRRERCVPQLPARPPK